MNVPKRKLIEVALPLEKINAESAREKSIRHGHPSTLHLWWARRPLAAARAVLFAQLVDDPSSHPDRFPTDNAVNAERTRLHQLIEELAMWNNSNDENLLRRANQEILDSTGGSPPPILDPFAGGGTIPLEAQRLGLQAHASDLNPVSVLINKALIEFPRTFAGRPPVFPDAAEGQIGLSLRAIGLAEDVRLYGQWMRDEAEKRIGHLYLKAKLPDGSPATVIAWIWTRTVTCPNPACGISLPLVRSWWLGKKKGKESYVVPSVISGNVTFSIGHALAEAPNPETDGTVGRTGARCIACSAAVSLKYIRAEGRAGRMGAQLMAMVAEGKRTRVYLAPTLEHEVVADVNRPQDVPDAELPQNARDFKTPNYGMTRFSDLFTSRQLVALTTFCDLVSEAREKIHTDALSAGLPEGDRLEKHGRDAAAYADAVATYLGFALSKSTARNNEICTWEIGMDRLRGSFQRQAIPITWDYAEANPLEKSGGGFLAVVQSECEVIESLRVSSNTPAAFCSQGSAESINFDGRLLSTDPPYYDNIGYSDLSDFFYIWLRRSLGSIHVNLLSTVLTPKADELVANPYRQGGADGARRFFEAGFGEVFQRARNTATTDFPATVYYAFKQSEVTSDGHASTGWETLLEGMVRAGWAVTATWPMRSELGSRMLGQGTNALASAIILALRPRLETAARIDRRGFVAALKDELPTALRELQQGAIAPVDLAQAAIGPGMAVFTRYSAVLEDDGGLMRVRTALARINEVLDEVLAEQEGDFDSDTRFALAWFRQHGFEAGPFGSADGLARARNASLEHLERAGILTSRAGKVILLGPSVLSEHWDPTTDTSLSTWEVVMHLARVLTARGVPAASQLLSQIPTAIDRDLCKELAFLTFTLAEGAKLTKVAVEFNALGTAWNDIEADSRTSAASGQIMFDFSEE